jgi:hypothetical protein
MVKRVLMVPELLDPRIFQPAIVTGKSLLLYSSTNSSLAPLGPRVLNSLITMAGVAIGDGLGLGVAEGVGKGLGDGNGETVGEGLGAGLLVRFCGSLGEIS